MDDLVMSIVMNDYLSLRDLRACKVVSRDWNQMASYAASLPRIKNEAAKTIQRAWRGSKLKARKRYERDAFRKLVRALGRDAAVAWRKELTEISPMEAFGGHYEVALGRGQPRRVRFFGSGFSKDHTKSSRGWAVLSRNSALVTNFRAKWRREAKSAPLESLGVRVPNILDHPDAVIPIGLMAAPSYVWVPRGCKLSWTSYHLPRHSEFVEGPINGLPGFALTNRKLVPSDRERALASPKRILGKYAD